METTETIQPNVAEAIKEKLRRLLIISKPGDLTLRNVLAMLGLHSIAFPDGKKTQIMWDEAEITVLSHSYGTKCNCDPKDPKVAKVGEAWHGNRCDLAMSWKMLHHPNLINVDEDEDSDTTTWTFQWPRELEQDRTTIQVVFPELTNDTFWGNFKKAWAGVVGLMPEPQKSLAERAESAPIQVQEPAAVVQEADGYDDMDLGTAQAPEVEPILVAEPGPVVEPTFTDKEACEIIEQEVPEVKRGRGRPKGTGKRQQAKELDVEAEIRPGELVSPAQGEPIPACARFARVFTDEMERLSRGVEATLTAEKFPVEQIKDLKESLDRLALKAAHLEFWGNRGETTKVINPMIAVTVNNLAAQTRAAIRDLELAPERPAAWEAYSKAIKECKDKSDSLQDVMVQPGMGPAIEEE